MRARVDVKGHGAWHGVVAAALLCATAAMAAQPVCTDPAPQNVCSVGGGSAGSDCNLEWILSRSVNTPGGFDRLGRPLNTLLCYEGDPRCDFDPNLNNNSCSMHVALCINNADPRVSQCIPSAINTFEVIRPNPSRLVDSADTINLATLEGQAGTGGFGVTVLRAGASVFNGAPNATLNLCANPLSIVVPLRQLRSGKLLSGRKTLRTEVVTSFGVTDRDAARLRCLPSTCGNGRIEVDHETCEDGNRLNGDGCDQSCQVEPATATPATSATPTLTSTPTLTPVPGVSTSTPTATLTSTNTPVPVATPTATITSTPTSTPVASPVTRTCTFRSGTQASLQVKPASGLALPIPVPLTGFQQWQFFPAGAGNVRPVVVPQGGAHFDPATLPAGAGTLCARLGSDGSGTMDCDGGDPLYDVSVEQDHNTTAAPPPGFAQDSSCSATFSNPGSQVSSASLEDGSASHPHTGICNSPVHITESGSFAAGGMKLTERLFVRIISSGSCPADSDPFDGPAGDIDVTGSVSTGLAEGVIYNVANTANTMGVLGAGNGANICGLFGNGSACSTEVQGIPFGCTNVDNNVLNTGKLGFAFTLLDFSVSGNPNDAIATLTILCN